MSIATVIDGNYRRLQHQLMHVAEVMPADRYSFRPTPQARSFGEQFRHIGAVQYVVGAGLLNEPPPADVGDGDSGPLLMTGKPEIQKYVLDSFSYIRRAIRSITQDNALELMPHPFDPESSKTERLAIVVGYATHGWEHYGQMVVYWRLNGICSPPDLSLSNT
jgi:hypothetical protein